MKIYAEIKNHLWTFEKDRNHSLKEKSKAIAYSFTPLGNNRFNFVLNGKSHLLHLINENGTYHVHLNGTYFPVRVEDERTRQLRKLVEKRTLQNGGQTVVAPIPGLITRIRVKKGDEVKRGDGIVLLEAMKMENEIKAEVDGIVSKILVNEGVSVEKDQSLIVIE